MPWHPHIAHWIGTIGELLNFAGALVLAADLFLRRREPSEVKSLNRLGQWGGKHGLSAGSTRKCPYLLELDEKFGISDNLKRELMRPVTTRIVSKFQVTVPPEIREIFDLQEGDLLEWIFDEATGEIRVIAKRAQLITPRVLELVQESQASRSQAVTVATKAATSR